MNEEEKAKYELEKLQSELAEYKKKEALWSIQRGIKNAL